MILDEPLSAGRFLARMTIAVEAETRLANQRKIFTLEPLNKL